MPLFPMDFRQRPNKFPPAQHIFPMTFLRSSRLSTNNFSPILTTSRIYSSTLYRSIQMSLERCPCLTTIERTPWIDEDEAAIYIGDLRVDARDSVWLLCVHAVRGRYHRVRRLRKLSCKGCRIEQSKVECVRFGRDCGAIGGYTRNVSIFPVTGILPNAPANALSLELHDTTA